MEHPNTMRAGIPPPGDDVVEEPGDLRDPILRLDQMNYRLDVAIYQRGEILKLLRGILTLQVMIFGATAAIVFLAFFK